MSDINQYYYNGQIKRYLVQFMAIFAGMQVKLGKNATKEARLITVPIHYGYKDRVVAHILGDNTQNKLLRLPALSAHIAGIELAPQRRKGVNQSRRNTYMPAGKVFPDDVRVVHQLMPIPYTMNIELAMYVSSTDQEHQILEQILMMFDPDLQIQTSDDVFDWTKLTTVELSSIRPEQNFPSGAERRVIQVSLDFTVPIYLSTPADVKRDFVERMYVRLGVVDTATRFDGGLDGSFDVIAQAEEQGFDYEKWLDIDDIDLTQTS
jgi:hypothetical protein